VIDRIVIKIENEIEIVIGDIDHVAEIVGSDHVLVPRIAEIGKEAIHRRKVAALEEESHLYIGMFHHQVLNILLLYR